MIYTSLLKLFEAEQPVYKYTDETPKHRGQTVDGDIRYFCPFMSIECHTSHCMAWQWEKEFMENGEIVRSETRGYCGLI